MKLFAIRFSKTLYTLGLVISGLLFATCAFSWNGFTLAQWWRESHSGLVLTRADTSEKVVAITFDDGPDPRNTPRVLAILRRFGVHATFFVEGRFVSAHPELVRAIVADGNEVGNHTVTHPYLNRKSASEVRAEMQGCEQDIEKTIHTRTHLFRPPRGAWNPTIFREARREDDHIVLWTAALEHHEVHTPQAMAARALQLIRPGGILLMHDGAFISRETTVEALPLVLDGLRARGYRIVTVSEMFHIRGNEPVLRGKEAALPGNEPVYGSTPDNARPVL